MKQHTTLKSKFNSAFSLVELLVVIAVIAVIAAIAIPNITGARDAAVAARTAANAEEVNRFLSNVNGAGCTNADGSVIAVGQIIDGFSVTSPQGIVFTFTQAAP
jgi:type IV pilus assembly protein PilA